MHFWTDSWVPDFDPLCDLIDGGISIVDSDILVKDCVTNQGTWAVNRFNHLLPSHVSNRIMALFPPQATGVSDSIAWGLAKDGLFTLASAYDALQNSEDHIHKRLLTVVWQWKGTERIRALLWKLSHEAILTNENRNKKEMATFPHCSICNGLVEDLFYVFRECPIVHEVWVLLLGTTNPEFFSIQECHGWLHYNLSARTEVRGLRWNLLFGFMLDNTWWRRNGFIFNNSNCNASELVFKSIRMSQSFLCTGVQFNKVTSASCGEDVQVRWISPGIDELGLNCDGSVTSAGSLAACGGVARDFVGNFLFGFAMKLGGCSILTAELWGILNGLKIAWNRGFRRIKVFSDSKVVVDLINAGCGRTHECHRLVSGILDVSNGKGSISWHYILREANQIADALAKHGLSLDSGFKVLDFPPNFKVDVSCISFPRGL